MIPQSTTKNIQNKGCTNGQQVSLTSIRWEFTFFPFLFQLTFGLGSPVAWQTKETTPPETPIWSTGTFVKRGSAEEQDNRERGRGQEEREIHQQTKGKCSTTRANAILTIITFLKIQTFKSRFKCTHPQRETLVQNVSSTSTWLFPFSLLLLSPQHSAASQCYNFRVLLGWVESIVV